MIKSAFTSHPFFTLVLAKAQADPRSSIGGRHHEIAEEFRRQRSRITLRTFSWEQPGTHRYRQP